MAKHKQAPDKNNTHVKNQTKLNNPVKRPEGFNGNHTEPTGNGMPTPRKETWSCFALLQSQFSHMSSLLSISFIWPEGIGGVTFVEMSNGSYERTTRSVGLVCGCVEGTAPLEFPENTQQGQTQSRQLHFDDTKGTKKSPQSFTQLLSFNLRHLEYWMI